MLWLPCWQPLEAIRRTISAGDQDTKNLVDAALMLTRDVGAAVSSAMMTCRQIWVALGVGNNCNGIQGPILTVTPTLFQGPHDIGKGPSPGKHSG